MTFVLFALLLQADKPVKTITDSVKTLSQAPHYSHGSTYKGKRFEGKISGYVRKDVHLPLEEPEIYAKGSNVLVKTKNGRYVPPNQVDTQSTEGKALAAFRNPDTMLGEIEAAAQQIAPEKRDDENDRLVFVVTLPTDMKKSVIKSMAGSFTGPIPMPNPDQFIDYDKTLCRYLVWISKADKSLVQYKFELEVAAKKGGMPMGMPGGFDPASWTMEILAEISTQDVKPNPIPKEVQNKLGIK